MREQFLRGGPTEGLRDGYALSSNGAAAAAFGGSSTRGRGNREHGRAGGQAGAAFKRAPAGSGVRRAMARGLRAQPTVDARRTRVGRFLKTVAL